MDTLDNDSRRLVSNGSKEWKKWYRRGIEFAPALDGDSCAAKLKRKGFEKRR